MFDDIKVTTIVLMHKKKGIDLDLRKESQAEIETLRRRIDTETQKELDQYKSNKKAEYENELHEKKIQFETRKQEKLDAIERELKKKHHHAIRTLNEQLQLDEDKAKIEAREDAEKALERAEKQTKQIAESKTRQQLKDIAVEFERKLEDAKNEIKAHNHTELIHQTSTLELKYKEDLEDVKLEMENQHERTLLQTKERLHLEHKQKKDKIIQVMEEEAKSDLELLMKREKLSFEADINTMKSEYANEQQKKEDEEVAHLRKEYNLKMEEEKAKLKAKAQEDLKRRIRHAIEEINQDHDDAVKRLNSNHDEQKNIRIQDLRKAMQQENQAEYDRFRERSIQAIEATCQQVQDEYVSERRTYLRQIQNELEVSYQTALTTMENDHVNEIERVRTRKYKELDNLISEARNKILQKTLEVQDRLRKAFDRDARTATNMLRELFGQTEDRNSHSTDDGDSRGWLNSNSYVSKLQHQYSILHNKFTKMSEKLADCGVDNARLQRQINDLQATRQEEASLTNMTSHSHAKTSVVEKLVNANEDLVTKLSNLGKRYTNLEQLFNEDVKNVGSRDGGIKIWSPSPRKSQYSNSNINRWISPTRTAESSLRKQIFSSSQNYDVNDKDNNDGGNTGTKSLHISRRGSVTINSSPSTK